MEATIVSAGGIILAGIKNQMSINEDRTFELFRSFMPRRKELVTRINDDVFCVQVYPPGYFNNFKPTVSFEKWAAMEINSATNIPGEMEVLEIPAGKYALFHFTGHAGDGYAFMERIYRQWLPASGFLLDDRPHFEIMGEKYRPDSAESEEKIYIPVKS